MNKPVFLSSGGHCKIAIGVDSGYVGFNKLQNVGNFSV